MEENTHRYSSYNDFKAQLKEKNGFVRSYWCGSNECENGIKYDTNTTIRCLLNESEGKSIYYGKKAASEWLFAIAY